MSSYAPLELLPGSIDFNEPMLMHDPGTDNEFVVLTGGRDLLPPSSGEVFRARLLSDLPGSRYKAGDEIICNVRDDMSDAEWVVASINGWPVLMANGEGIEPIGTVTLSLRQMRSQTM